MLAVLTRVRRPIFTTSNRPVLTRLRGFVFGNGDFVPGLSR
jgi:hypothetical protein